MSDPVRIDSDVVESYTCRCTALVAQRIMDPEHYMPWCMNVTVVRDNFKSYDNSIAIWLPCHVQIMTPGRSAGNEAFPYASVRADATLLKFSLPLNHALPL